MTERSLSRRSVLGLVAALAVGTAGCAAAGSGSTAQPQPAASTIVPEPLATPTDKDAYIAAGPPRLDPARFAHAQFVGAIEFNYQGARTSSTAKEADAKYKVYFKGSYVPPQPGDRNGIRLNAMGDPRDGNRLLYKGAIIDNITLPNEIVLGLHNITRIEGGVEINGEYFEGRVAGANGTLVIGDKLTVWVSDPFYPELVDRYVYEVVPSESGGDYVVVDVGEGYEDLIYRPSPSEDYNQLSLYTCWPPNQSISRLVTRFKLVESAVVAGSVKPVEV